VVSTAQSHVVLEVNYTRTTVIIRTGRKAPSSSVTHRATSSLLRSRPVLSSPVDRGTVRGRPVEGCRHRHRGSDSFAREGVPSHADAIVIPE
jgi:hypothetical protein